MPTDTEHPNRPSIEEARAEAAQISSRVGEKGTTENYAQAHSALVELKTKELLEKKHWLQILNFTVNIIDKIQETKNKKRSSEHHAHQEETSIKNSSARLERLYSDKELLTIESKKIEEGGDTLNVKLYGDALLFGLFDVAQEEKEREIKQSILDKLRKAEEEIRETEENAATEVSLYPEEIKLIKKAIASAMENVGSEIIQLDESLNEHRKKYELTHNNQIVQNQEITDLTDMLKASIAVLDQREEKKGAPAYPNGTESNDEQHQAYIKRIEWRQEQVQAMRDSEAPAGKEIGRKWAFYAKINDKYLLLNKKNAFSDVYPQSILTNRIPGETFAIASEGMTITEDISIQSIIRNGVLEEIPYELRAPQEKELKKHYEEIRNQLRR